METSTGGVRLVDGSRPRVFQIGFNRCGTLSLAYFFHDNGVPAAHWWNGELSRAMRRNAARQRPLLQGFEQFTFFADMEHFDRDVGVFRAHVEYFRELDRQYPRSKFILNTRDIESWIESRLNFAIDGVRGAYAEHIMKCLKLSRPELIDLWRADWGRHHGDVLRYFEGRPQDLLVFDIETDPIERLVEFFQPTYDLDPAKWQRLNTSRPA